jgi:hypothetical protein
MVLLMESSPLRFQPGRDFMLCFGFKYPDLFNYVACLSSYPEDKLLTNIVKDKKKLEKFVSLFLTERMML